uniref:StAR-related lipid transfer protein 13 n=1 Tax=Timema genevievae TaxID=629358 RepID=A0A7R9K3B8_TIMGE|nr:unnamed protein product [Timema genevievae]
MKTKLGSSRNLFLVLGGYTSPHRTAKVRSNALSTIHRCDLQFPIDVSGVQKDHPFLDPDSLHSLFRRLHALNRCANMKVDNVPKNKAEPVTDVCKLADTHERSFKIESYLLITRSPARQFGHAVSRLLARLINLCWDRGLNPEPPAQKPDTLPLDRQVDDSDEDDSCALSENWTFQPESRRWSRVCDVTAQHVEKLQALSAASQAQGSPGEGDMARHPQEDEDEDEEEDEEDYDPEEVPVISSLRYGSLPPCSLHPGGDQELMAVRFRRTGSERLRDGAKALLKRMESLKSRRRRRQNREGVVISGPQRGSSRPDSYLFRQDSSPIRGAHPMNSLSCGQLLVLRKLALLKLTACMERYCPTHRTGWNWELPKFIRKIKSPDYKDKTVFGVPLLLSLQRNGQALPKCIQAALRWLRVNSLDQVGLFRKSGVRSRIQKLKLIAESQGESISYEGQQAYDVADMVKQYFRELPEALLTNKLSETFTAIFQHVPVNLRMEAVQCVVLLLPDEHREALQTLLEFLSQVSARAACNQMTASNLAVCLAPSLFHLHHAPSSTTSRSTSASPRRRKTVGVPDPRELSENKAAHDCLLYLIKEHKDLFVVTEEMMTQCHFSYMEESVPVALEELGTELHQDWRGYLYTCTTALLKEARDRSRGWVNVSCATDTLVDVAYKKVGDGHPLRLWRVSTEVEAPPLEVLQRVLRERHVWDTSLLKWRVVARLDALAEVFQYVCANMAPLAAKDFCVLRSWRTDLPKGACVIVETSVEHPDGPVMLGGVRGIVLASRYLIEPCGSGKSRIMHLSRVDTKGRTPEWYNKSYGHICALYLTRIRTSFKHNADGPESKAKTARETKKEMRGADNSKYVSERRGMDKEYGRKNGIRTERR